MMKMRHVFLLAVLLVSLPALVSCDLFGSSKEELRKQQIEAYQQQLEAYQKAQDEYYQSIEKSLNDYNQAYSEWQQNELQQKLQQVPEVDVVIATANQTQP
jgi:type II secretory pathway pseudopilin PulG